MPSFSNIYKHLKGDGPMKSLDPCQRLYYREEVQVWITLEVGPQALWDTVWTADQLQSPKTVRTMDAFAKYWYAAVI